MKKALRTLRSRVGRVMRDVERQFDSVADTGRSALQELIGRTKRILSQKQRDKNKLYALHAPEVECLAKVQSPHTLRIRCESVDHDDPQRRARGWRPLDAGKPIRWSYVG
jgi:transposase, IS5 family